ncbi:hypothetical protein ACGFZS_13005 [Streptomyces sp. NPDC048288]|uniref:hypothetical protein n=1 Tax=Streptomyces sp. NPDC048288 TaxID=3365529 RepID=UPI0037215D58
MLYDVTLPGNAPPTNLCPQYGCEAPFPGGYAQPDIAAWNTVVERDNVAEVKAFLQASGALAVRHTEDCPYRFLPPAVLELCEGKDLTAQHDKVWAVLDGA